MFTVCAACLTLNRRVTPLSSLKHALAFLDGCNIEWDVEQDTVCWECEAMLLKTHRFVQQARRAQGLIHMHRRTVRVAEPLRSFSKLKTYTKTSYDRTFVNGHVHVKDECGDTSFSTNVHQRHDHEKFATLPKHEIQKTSDINYIEIKLENPIEIEDQIISEENDIDSQPHDEQNTFLDNEETDKSDEKEMSPKTEAGQMKSNFNCFTKDEEKFTVKNMTFEEMLQARDLDRNSMMYKACSHKCEKCIIAYFNEERLKIHMKDRHSESLGVHKCSICDIRFPRKGALDDHYENHFRRFQCQECTYSHHKLQKMLLHYSKEHEFKNFKCNICNKEFASFPRLRYHRSKTHMNRPKCEQCGKTFVNENGLKVHMNRLHKSPVIEECPQCGRRYRDLKAHLRTHASGGQDAYCVECARQFRTVYIYRRHLVNHANHRQDGALKLSCPQCEARFYSKTNLARHVAAKHTGLFPFTCDACGKGFNRKDRLSIHILETHEGGSRPKDKICSYCGKGFKCTEVLRNHIRTHTGEKPFQCKHCPWRFAQRVTLRTHVRALHPANK